MAQVFTITQTTPYTFTASVARSTLSIQKTTTPLSVSTINPGFTATVLRNVLNVSNDTATTVTIVPQAASTFTGSIVENVYQVSKTQFTVTATNVQQAYPISRTDTSVTVTYNPSLVEHLYDGQPVYTTSSVQFAELTLGTTSTYTFPAYDGEFGQTIVTDGLGNLFWAFAGGGGGIGTWNLNTDLTTNGFKIKSGGDTVDLELQGGFGSVKLDDTSTYIIHSGTGALSFINEGATTLTNGDRQLVLSSGQVKLELNTTTGITIGSSTSSIHTGNIEFVGGQAFFDYGAVVFDATSLKITAPIEITRNVTLTQLSNLSAQDVTATRQFISDRGYLKDVWTNRLNTYDYGFIEVPPLKFPDGSIQYGAQTLVSTATISLGGPLYTNNNPIKSNTSVGTLKLQQGENLLQLSNDGSTSTGFTVIPKAGSEIHFFTATNGSTILNITSDQINFTASSSTFAHDVFFRENIRFADGLQFNGDLADLREVQLSSPQAGQVLKYNGSYWYNGSDSGSTGTGVDTLIGGTGIAVSTSSGDITITNTGVQSLSGANGIVVDKSTGSVEVSIGNLPIVGEINQGISVDNSTFGTTSLAIDRPTLWSYIDAGPGIGLAVDGSGRLQISQTATSILLGGNLYTAGYNIDATNHQLTIRAGETYAGTTTFLSSIAMPVSDPMRIYSSYGMVLDTPDDRPIEIQSPLKVISDGTTRIEVKAVGQTNLTDTIIAITATNKVILNKSVIGPTSVKLQADSGDAYIEVNPTTSTIAGSTIVIASTGTTKIGPDIYHSNLNVQRISNWNDTGPFTASKGVQYPDASVQLTAYLGTLDFGVLGTPSSSPIDFILQITGANFGTFAEPTGFNYDAGVLE